ncbi:similar to Saccharomyces cerevisiae YJL076W NET1 Core subunit of the RENT complex, which is a complex involved in nucleolar silencing and telophase exit [Maudiozyma barnettii]|uniref:Similar to Saccharomyces cerevisiae YJL076W NET1 Core subunit of the RENT complex, which is a complex involved in nucleolar silencing and telophase exit n=1 Tax=Maudiozyma barnettii TaxID=61262 RepID=A0A8H2ZKG1_9SACH|nr:Net1p [Kazachstania barnettii]CAB4256938.1 similar to Saccharomyces cerevisiae YJL076W NET1 Core subunit of the RENT complex, which is a complex involved in nucleolar silencing and telophase exit [Kazachstania barnettii]CAD1785543.1 similar to Saccharomyces cerevisiae YJL076W NET1 Core subunit of the RENT complex, which is a complex involved in nucleolar silencing and telophase exit [Kazachstania barnettii]
MYKLQLQLIPPSAVTTPAQSNASQQFFNNSLMSANMSGISLNNFPANYLFRRDSGMHFNSGRRNIDSSAIPRINSNIKRVLHFTKKTINLQRLGDEIIEKIGKMYPNLESEIEIETLQDQWGCDLDPDFIVGEVFTTESVVQVLLKNDIDWNEHVPVSGYANKRMKVMPNNTNRIIPSNAAQTHSNPPLINITNASNGDNETNGIILPKRTMSQPSKGTFYKGIRISTPLVHQIYRPHEMPDQDHAVDPRNKSILPPPSQPQSPPIRISSGIETGKRIRSLMEDDTVSRSETVDPQKSKQQILQFNSPHIPITTPNRTDMTIRNVYYNTGKDMSSYDQNKISAVKRQQPLRTPKVGSIKTHPDNKGNGEPQSGSTPLTNGSSFKTKISTSAVRSLYSHQVSVIAASTKENTNIDDVISTQLPEISKITRNHEKIPRSPPKALKRQQSSIADNNGSPVKNIPILEQDDNQVHLAALPDSEHGSLKSSSIPGRQTQQLTGKGTLEETTISDATAKAPVKAKTIGYKKGEKGVSMVQDDSKITKTNNSVNMRSAGESVGNSSFQKKHLLEAMQSKSSRIPAFLRGDAQNAPTKRSFRKKPYTTVLHKDIDNSKPDPRNILPKHMPRNAARKAAQKLSGNPDSDTENSSESDTDNENDVVPSTLSDEEDYKEDGNELDTDTGIETDYFSDNSTTSPENPVEIEKQPLTLNIDPIKERMVTELDTQILPDQQSATGNEHETPVTINGELAENMKDCENVIPDSKGSLLSHHDNGTFSTISGSVSNTDYQSVNEYGLSNGSSFKTVHEESEKIEIPHTTSQPGKEIPDADERRSHLDSLKNIKYQTGFLQHQKPKTRPSLHTIMDIKEKNFQTVTDNKALDIPLEQEGSLDEETSRETSSENDSDYNDSMTFPTPA